MKGAGATEQLRTERDLNLKLALGIILALLVILVVLPNVPIGIPGALMILFFGFFFGAVAARMVGLVGSSNSPVSGITIAVMIFTALILKLTGADGTAGMIGAISVGAVVCIIMAIAGDTSQDLKTGFLLGATPKKQQIGEIIGVVASALAIGWVLILLNSAWGFGSIDIPAPQATLMKMLVEGVMSGNLPWGLIFIGVFLAVVVQILGLPVLPVAIGLYLPLELSVTVMIGGILRWLADRSSRKKGREEGGGLLFCSGLVAGEGLVGILLAILAVAGVSESLDLSDKLNTGTVGAIAAILLVAAGILWFSRAKKKGETK
jgi:putative OPT family oligopeptide transporter